MPDTSAYQYWRNPTEGEIAWGHGCIHFANFRADECHKADGTPKKWLKYDGLRYNLGHRLFLMG